jgi:hypothetical protein
MPEEHDRFWTGNVTGALECGHRPWYWQEFLTTISWSKLLCSLSVSIRECIHWRSFNDITVSMQAVKYEHLNIQSIMDLLPQHRGVR